MATTRSTENDRTDESPAGFGKDNAESAPLEEVDSSFMENLGRGMDSALGSILDSVSQLQDDPSDIERLATQIRGRGERLRRIFRSLEHLARLSEDQGHPDPEEVNAADLTQSLLADTEPLANEKGLALTLEGPASTVEMTTHAKTLRQALGHLLTNAIEVTPEGEVTLHVDAEDSVVAFHVEDNGPGGSSEDLSSIFEPFTQRSSEQGSSPTGLGLDLTLAQAFSHHLKGTLESESEAGGGSVLTLRVPRDPASTVRSDTDEDTDEGDGQESPHLLVVEDSDVTRRLLRRMLRKVYHVDTAEEAGEAIQKAGEKAYDAFVLDVNLQDRRTGVEVLQAVRKMEGYGAVPMVACTAYALDDHRDHFLRAGFDDVVTKPVTKREILDVIDRRLNEPVSSEVDGPDVSLSGIELPPIPATLTEVAGLASSPDPPDVDALTEALQKDAVVSQWLIGHINSAYYGLRESIDTVERAVRYLGFQPVCNLILTKVIGESFSGTDEPEGEQVQQYIMRTGVLAAYIARELSEEIGFDAPEVAYTGGMLAQIGRLALLEEEGKTYVDLWFEEHDRSASFRGPPPQGQEILHFEQDHVQNGLAVGKECGLSDKLTAVLSGQHRPGRVSERFQPLVPIVALALEAAGHAEKPADENRESGEGDLTSDLQASQVTRLVAEQGPLSEKKLAGRVVEIVEDAEEFVDEALDTA